LCAQAAVASTVKGTVADPLGARVPGAEVQLVAQGAVVAHVKSAADGTFTLTAPAGRYMLRVTASGFNSKQSESFFLSGAELSVPVLTLAPSRLAQSVTVTATGTPIPRAQVSSAVTVLGEQELENRQNVTMPLNLVPGVTLTQTGQAGGVASIFIRGGSSTATKVLMNGVPADDVGGRFDFSTVSATDLDTVEVFRGPDSVLYGSDAAAGVVSFSTRQGTSATPLLEYAADGGNFNTLHTAATVSGAADRLDYFAGFDLLGTGNSIPLDKFHDTTFAGNVGYALDSRNQLRFTGRNSVSSTGVPNALDFYGIADPARQGDQDLYLTAAYDSRTTDRWHNVVRYGVARKREQYTQYGTNGILDQNPNDYSYEYNYLGLPVTIRGANGYSVTGAAILDYGGTTYPYADLLVSNRDQLYAESDYSINAHTTALFSFRYENERGLDGTPYGVSQAQRTNYDYTLQLGGDIRNRLFYSLGGGLQKNEVFGVDAEPRLGLAYYVIKPGSGMLQGTKLMFNFSKGLQEPSITDQTGSLYAELELNGLASLIPQYGITPVSALQARTYDGGAEQVLFHQRATVRARYFHNEFGNQVEYVDTQALADLPGGGVSQTLIDQLENAGVYGAYINSLSYRAQGVESELEAQLLAHLFLRLGYTYVDARVQHSFSSDALTPQSNPAFPSVPLGAYDPLVGARPFRIPPHKGYFEAIYQQPRWFVSLTGSLVSRADDSTFLSDANYGNTLLLPNRDLDPSYERLDLGGSYAVRPWMSFYAQADNLLSQQRAGVLGYPALPVNFRSGIKFTLDGK
jgi:iron complex outermembrane receptor protein/vitamin B12 transporter